MSWKDFYKKNINPFGAKGPFYGPAGHHGVDFAAKAHQAIPSYFSGVCVLNGHSSVLGYWTVFRRSDGQLAGFAHCLVGTRKNVGDKVQPGDTLYKAAGPGDDHGSAWSGPHCHTTLAKSDPNGIWNGNVVDPWPSIKAAIAGASTPAKAPAWKFKLPSAKTQKRVQAALKKRGRYKGPVDGKMATESLKGVQRTLKQVGWRGTVDGKIDDAAQCRAIQVYAERYGDYDGPVDAKPEEQSWIGFALGLERP